MVSWGDPSESWVGFAHVKRGRTGPPQVAGFCSEAKPLDNNRERSVPAPTATLFEGGATEKATGTGSLLGCST